MRAHFIAALVAILGGLIAAAGAFEFTWTDRHPLPAPVAGGYLASFGDVVIYAGGAHWRDGVKYWLRDVSRYDVLRDRWDAGPPLPVPLAYGGFATVNGSIEIYGGSDGKRVYRDCWRLNPAKDAAHDAWTPIGKLESDSLLARASNLTGRVYLFGGCPDVVDLTHCSDGVQVRGKGWNWRSIANMPQGRVSDFASAVVQDRVYLFGGCTMPTTGKLISTDAAYRFDARTLTWHKLRPLPRPNRGQNAVAVDDDHILLLGGFTASEEEAKGKPPDFGFSAEVIVYDIAKDEYRTAPPLPLAVSGMEAVMAGRLVLALGGEDRMRGRTDRVLAGKF